MNDVEDIQLTSNFEDITGLETSLPISLVVAVQGCKSDFSFKHWRQYIGGSTLEAVHWRQYIGGSTLEAVHWRQYIGGSTLEAVHSIVPYPQRWL